MIRIGILGIPDQFAAGNTTNVDRLVRPRVINESGLPWNFDRRAILGLIGRGGWRFGNCGIAIYYIGKRGIIHFGLRRGRGITTLLVPNALSLSRCVGIGFLRRSENLRRYRNSLGIDWGLLTTISRWERSTTREKETDGSQAAHLLDGNHRFNYQLGLGILG